MIDYIASLDSTHWVLLTVALGSSIIAIVQFMSQPEMRALWADVRDRLLINDLQAKDEARLRELVTGPLTTGEPLINEARLREMAREPYPPMKAVRWVDSEYPQEMGVDSDLAALRKRDAERSGKQISDDLDRTWSDELDRAWRRQYPTLDSFYAALRKRDAERRARRRQA